MKRIRYCETLPGMLVACKGCATDSVLFISDLVRLTSEIRFYGMPIAQCPVCQWDLLSRAQYGVAQMQRECGATPEELVEGLNEMDTFIEDEEAQDGDPIHSD